ncbi:hypothetical protein CLOM_g1700 [Closterium sp. NIES-68]|nr:hypothetical protein CLOM_g1700 [Closterium sp. NIES-68]GJP68966.1 hypothetical protein CLOP_g25601 [Closterium sp. NIES-67]
MSKAAQAKKRGLSLEEKREKMLEIFYESKDFFLLTAEVGELQAKKARLEQRLESAQAGRQESEDRSRALADLAGLQAKNQKLKKELEEFAENDPELLEHKTKVTRIAKDAANRWTENIFSLQQWCNDQFPEASEKLAQLYQEVGITDDIDYVE